ncbi:hypothetical protein RFM68_31120 [Mesorhizobium sp. MSK_1335]|uniref:ABC transmembrane type-1 domain-containing protein n=1 Tax=Mesorhizobium montanum TaxID=3072323 RepID=A0ABU4ZU42_9HYPH|nr:hypothetical protein [Mesorhizobium sp. MSK_1335]MDX8528930.1 hypothetical protein [Mesorhizobium sp. MSK_1335]
MPKVNERNMQNEILQIMTTEHFVLQTARAATIQEASQRANLFLTTVSSVAIALGFAQVTRMGGPFVLFSLILLPCLYFLGLVTFVRAVQVAIEDMVHARGMARIRHYYIERAPVTKPYLIHSTHDDQSAVLVDKALESSPWQFFVTAAGLVSAISSAIAGVFSSVVMTSVIGAAIPFSVIMGLLIFGVSTLLLRRYHLQAWAAAEEKLVVRFPDAPKE